MTTLAQYGRVRAALAEAVRIDEVLPIIDEIAQVKLYAAQIENQELMADAAEFQMRAERKLGFIISQAKKAGHFAEGRRKKPKPEENGSSYTAPLPVATLEEVGVSKKLSARSQKRSSIAEQAFEAMVRGIRDRIAASNAVPVNGDRSIAPGRKEPSASLDFSPTPPWATRALIERVLPAMGIDPASLRHMTADEPACGEGHMAEVLEEYFCKVTASDIHDYGYGESPWDFLSEDFTTEADWIITNPPFKEKAEQFALKAIDQAKVGAAIFARLQWLETIGRYERLFRDHPPTQLAFFAERVNLCMGRWEPNGGTATAYIWLVWLKGEQPRAPFWIPPECKEKLSKPDDEQRFTAHPVVKIERPKTEAGEILLHDEETGEIAEDAALFDDLRAPEPTWTFEPMQDVCCERDQPQVIAQHIEPEEPHLNSESDQLDIPAFLDRRVPVASESNLIQSAAGPPNEG